MGWLGRSLQARGALAAAIEIDNRAIALGKPRRGVERRCCCPRSKPQARALRGLGRTREAITHARDALAAARPSSDPALLLWALNVLLALDGDDVLAAEARGLSDATQIELPNEAMRRRFRESELEHTIPRR
jgi:hypothetical protein